MTELERAKWFAVVSSLSRELRENEFRRMVDVRDAEVMAGKIDRPSVEVEGKIFAYS